MSLHVSQTLCQRGSKISTNFCLQNLWSRPSTNSMPGSVPRAGSYNLLKNNAEADHWPNWTPLTEHSEKGHWTWVNNPELSEHWQNTQGGHVNHQFYKTTMMNEYKNQQGIWEFSIQHLLFFAFDAENGNQNVQTSRVTMRLQWKHVSRPRFGTHQLGFLNSRNTWPQERSKTKIT